MLKPINNYILIKPDTAIEMSDGMYIPTKEEEPTGEVLAIAEEVKKVKKGQRVLFRKFEITEYQGNYLVKEEDIICLL